MYRKVYKAIFSSENFTTEHFMVQIRAMFTEIKRWSSSQRQMQAVSTNIFDNDLA